LSKVVDAIKVVVPKSVARLPGLAPAFAVL